MPDKYAKHVLYLTYDGLTDPLGQSQVLPYLLALELEGFSFHIVSFEKPHAFQTEEQTIRQLLKDRKISWYPLVYHKWPPIGSAIYDLRQMWKAARRQQKQYTISTVWCRSYLPALVGLKLKNRYKLPFIFDMRGFWPDERVEGRSWKLSNPVYWLVYQYFKRKEKQLLTEANHVVVLTQKAMKILMNGQLQGVIPQSVAVVPCSVDAEHFDPGKVTEADKRQKRKELDLEENDKVLVYAGSLGTWYMVAEMLSYFCQLQKRDRTWKFLVISKDSPQAIMKQASETEICVDSIKVVAGSRNEMPLLLSLGDLAISFIMPVFSKQASSPTKLAEYMAMGLPVICNRGVGDVDEILGRSGAGFLVDINNFAGVDVPRLHEGNVIRLAAQSLFSLPKAVAVYRGLLN